jgi:hypothetical protein
MEKMQEMLNREDKEFSGVLSTAKTTLILYSDPLVQRSIEDSDFTINDLKHFKYPVSLYLVVPPSDIERLKPLLRLIFTMTVNRLTEELEEVRNSGCNKTSSQARHSRPARTTASCFSSTNSQHWERCLSSRRLLPTSPVMASRRT